jgi:hypothetical protein
MNITRSAAERQFELRHGGEQVHGKQALRG